MIIIDPPRHSPIFRCPEPQSKSPTAGARKSRCQGNWFLLFRSSPSRSPGARGASIPPLPFFKSRTEQNPTPHQKSPFSAIFSGAGAPLATPPAPCPRYRNRTRITLPKLYQNFTVVDRSLPVNFCSRRRRQKKEHLFPATLSIMGRCPSRWPPMIPNDTR